MSFGDIENLGLGGIGNRYGLARIFSGAGFTSEEEIESAAGTKVFTCQL